MPRTLPVCNIAQYAVDLVVSMGSDHVFTLTGGMAMHINRAVANHPKLKAIYCQHEQACVAAAEGYAKASNFRRAGFAVVTAGPGVSNTITSLISAYGDSTPLIVLAGQIKTNDIDSFGTRTHGVQEIRSQDLISPCVKRFIRLNPNNFRNELRSAIIDAFIGRPGPVFIEIPLDVQGTPITFDAHAIESDTKFITENIDNHNRSDVNQSRLISALHSLLSAKKPLIYVGNGVRIAGQESLLINFAEKYKIPLVFSWLSFDIVSSDHPLYFGCPGGLAPIYSNKVLYDADVIIFLGARLDLGTVAFQRESFGGQAHRWFIDVDARELSKFSDFVNTDTIEIDLKNLSDAVAATENLFSNADSDWLNNIIKLRSIYKADESLRLSSDKFNVYTIASILSDFSSDHIFVSASSGYAEETFTRFFKPINSSRFFNGAALGAMGMGLPNALGASFGSYKPVICLEADGGIMLNIQELATLSNYAPPGFILFVLNNDGYESIRSSQTRHFGDVYGADKSSGLFIPNFNDLAQAFNIDYIRIEDAVTLRNFMVTKDIHSAPIIVDLIIEKFEYRGPSVKTIFDENGFPSTTSLKDIEW